MGAKRCSVGCESGLLIIMKANLNRLTAKVKAAIQNGDLEIFICPTPLVKDLSHEFLVHAYCHKSVQTVTTSELREGIANRLRILTSLFCPEDEEYPDGVLKD